MNILMNPKIYTRTNLQTIYTKICLAHECNKCKNDCDASVLFRHRLQSYLDSSKFMCVNLKYSYVWDFIVFTSYSCGNVQRCTFKFLL